MLAQARSATRRTLIAGGTLAGMGLIAACSPGAADAKADPANSKAGVDLRLAMRKLWEDHITYTRNFIISALAGLPDQPAVTQRLLRNQDDIGSAIKPYYGDPAGAQLTQLLRDHILVAADVVGAAKAGDKATLDARQAAWSANGRDIAAFLSTANANWPKADLETMLQKHLDLTTGEVVARLGGDWEADIRSYDEGHEHMLMFADTLTAGIVKQHPDKFA